MGSYVGFVDWNKDMNSFRDSLFDPTQRWVARGYSLFGYTVVWILLEVAR
jgi:hypothetical protein